MAENKSQTVSFRVDPATGAELRDIANAKGCSVSDLLREGALMVAAELNTMTITWTAGPDVVGTSPTLTLDASPAPNRDEVERLTTALNIVALREIKQEVELERLRAAVARAEQATAALRKLHWEYEGRCANCITWCDCDSDIVDRHQHNIPWPCPTAKALAADAPAAAQRPGEIWDSTDPPGGYVCATCGTPTESEPCDEHGPAAAAEETP